MLGRSYSVVVKRWESEARTIGRSEIRSIYVQVRISTATAIPYSLTETGTCRAKGTLLSHTRQMKSEQTEGRQRAADLHQDAHVTECDNSSLLVSSSARTGRTRPTTTCSCLVLCLGERSSLAAVRGIKSGSGPTITAARDGQVGEDRHDGLIGVLAPFGVPESRV